MANRIRLPAEEESAPPQKSSPIGMLVSYLLVTGGGAVFGLFAAMCSMGGGARRGVTVMPSDAMQGAILLVGIVTGAALGFYAVYRTLGFKGIRANDDR